MIKQVVSNLIINKKFQILLLLRDNKPGIMYPGLWGFIGGKVEKGETPLMAAIREIKEETGLRIHQKRLKSFMMIQTPVKKYNVFLVSGDWRKNDLVRGEGRELRFVGIGETRKLSMSPYHRHVISILQDYLKQISKKIPPTKLPAVISDGKN